MKVTRICHFRAQIGSIIPHFPKTKIFFRRTNNMAFMYLLPPFIVQNFKILLRADLHLHESIIFRPNRPQNDPLAQNQNFSRLINIMFYFTYSRLSLCKAKRKSHEWISRKLINHEIFKPSHHLVPPPSITVHRAPCSTKNLFLSIRSLGVRIRVGCF